jgi:hypothetical protein
MGRPPKIPTALMYHLAFVAVNQCGAIRDLRKSSRHGFVRLRFSAQTFFNHEAREGHEVD